MKIQSMLFYILTTLSFSSFIMGSERQGPIAKRKSVSSYSENLVTGPMKKNKLDTIVYSAISTPFCKSDLQKIDTFVEQEVVSYIEQNKVIKDYKRLISSVVLELRHKRDNSFFQGEDDIEISPEEFNSFLNN
jgi:hypothetical protein